MVNGEMQTTTEWLVEKLRETEAERDAAIAHAKEMEVDNLRLRIKLQSISDYVSNEEYVEDIFIPDDYGEEDYPDCVIPENESDTPPKMPFI